MGGILKLFRPERVGIGLSILALIVVGALIIIRIIAKGHIAAEARKRVEEERSRRARSENELRERVERAKKNRDPLELSKRAIESDPARAAKTLSRMMQQD